MPAQGARHGIVHLAEHRLTLWKTDQALDPLTLRSCFVLLGEISEIEHMRSQIGRQRKEILQLQRASISTASAEALLARMQAKLDHLVAQRDEMKSTEPREKKTRVLGGRKW